MTNELTARIDAATGVEVLVLKKLGKGPIYMRSIKAAKPVAVRLINRGLIRRVRPDGGHAANMVELTDAGLCALAAALHPKEPDNGR